MFEPIFVEINGAPLPSTNGQAASGSPSVNGHHESSRRKTSPLTSRLSTDELVAYLNGSPAGTAERQRLGASLGVSGKILRQLRVGWRPESECQGARYLFPERDDLRRIIGLAERYADGAKRMVKGSRRGLVYDPDWSPGPDDWILVVEGPTDVAAALNMGLLAIGRPSNTGGADIIAALLGSVVRAGAKVVVLGENDMNPYTLTHPGRVGMEKFIQDLPVLWNRTVWGCLPPERSADGKVTIKDLRDWFCSFGVDPEDEAGCWQVGEQIKRYVEEHLTAGAPVSFGPVPALLGGGIVKGGETEKLTGAPAVKCSPQAPLSPAIRDLIARGVHSRPCPRHATPLLRGREAARGLGIRADCDACACLVCGLRKRCRWLLHLMGCFDAVAVGGLSQWQGECSRLAALVQLASRRGGAEYVSFATAGDQAVLIVDRALDAPHSRYEFMPLDVPGASDLAARSLLALSTLLRRPVTASPAWRLPSRVQRTNDYDFYGAGARGAFTQMLEYLERRRLRPLVSDVQPIGQRADWSLAGLTEDQIEDLYFHLSELGRRKPT